MSVMVTCPACGYDKNPPGTEFCDACGSEISGPSEVPDVEVPAPLVTEKVSSSDSSSGYGEQAAGGSSIPSPPIPEPSIPEPVIPEPVSSKSVSSKSGADTIISDPVVPESTSFPSVAGVAKLTPKQAGAPILEFAIDNGTAVIGIFDPDTGPVDVDLEGFFGHETVSRNHAEIYQDGTDWKIKDLGSTNGVFIRPAGQSRFNSRVTVPTVVKSGDEIAIAKIRLLFSCS